MRPDVTSANRRSPDQTSRDESLRVAGIADSVPRIGVDRDRCGWGLLADDPYGRHVRDRLAATYHHVVKRRGGHSLAAAPLRLLGRDEELPPSCRTDLLVPPGLVPAVAREAVRRGFEVAVGPDPPPLGPPDPDRVTKFAHPHPALHAFVARHDRGWIFHDPGLDPATIAVELAVCFEARFAINTNRREVAERIVAELDRHGVPAFAFVGGAEPQTPERFRVAVGTPDTLGQDQFRRRDLFIALVGPEALGKRSHLRWVSRRTPRAFVLVSTERPLAPLERDLLRGAAGFHELTLLPGGLVPPRVTVEWHRVDGRFEGPDSDMPGLVRGGIWFHDVRNRRVAGVARDAAAGGSVAVLAGSAEHAAALGRKLPGWPILASRDVDVVGMKRKDRDALRGGPEARRRRPAGRILTPEVARRADLASFDVVVRGGSGRGSVPGRAASGVAPDGDGPSKTVRLIDFRDGHHPALRRLAKARDRAYSAAGWLSPGTDPYLARIDAFLEDHGC